MNNQNVNSVAGTTIYDAQKLYTNRGYVTFPLKLSHQYNKKNELKKNVKPPPKFPEFATDTEQIFGDENAVGFLCGKTTNVIVIDVDNISDWQKLLDEVDEQEPSNVK